MDKKINLQSLVKDGVEEFILRHATIDEFWKSMHSASRKEKVYAHQLTGSVLERIVKLAVRQRKKELAVRHNGRKDKDRVVRRKKP
jgi:D-mannonate dehydratase